MRAQLHCAATMTFPSWCSTFANPAISPGCLADKAPRPSLIMETRMASYNKADLERRMAGAVESLRHDLGGLRTGRASTSLLDPITVEVYGANMPLSQVDRKSTRLNSSH